MSRPRPKRASYRHGIRWIAENDEPNDLDVETVAFYVSTLLLADLFGRDNYEIARAIVRERERGEG